MIIGHPPSFAQFIPARPHVHMNRPDVHARMVGANAASCWLWFGTSQWVGRVEITTPAKLSFLLLRSHRAKKCSTLRKRRGRLSWHGDHPGRNPLRIWARGIVDGRRITRDAGPINEGRLFTFNSKRKKKLQPFFGAGHAFLPPFVWKRVATGLAMLSGAPLCNS